MNSEVSVQSATEESRKQSTPSPTGRKPILKKSADELKSEAISNESIVSFGNSEDSVAYFKGVITGEIHPPSVAASMKKSVSISEELNQSVPSRPPRFIPNVVIDRPASAMSLSNRNASRSANLQDIQERPPRPPSTNPPSLHSRQPTNESQGSNIQTESPRKRHIKTQKLKDAPESSSEASNKSRSRQGTSSSKDTSKKEGSKSSRSSSRSGLESVSPSNNDIELREKRRAIDEETAETRQPLIIATNLMGEDPVDLGQGMLYSPGYRPSRDERQSSERSVSRGRRSERSTKSKSSGTKSSKTSSKKPKDGSESDRVDVNGKKKSKSSRKPDRVSKSTKEEQHSEPNIFEHVKKQASDFQGCITSLNVLRADALQTNLHLHCPLVQLHIIDEATGQYIKKSNVSRPVTTFNEPATLDYILPVITKPFDMFENKSVTPVWNDKIIINEEYLHLTKPGVMILFEVLDMYRHIKKLRKRTDGWHRVAWGFLKLVGSHNQSNTEQQVRLQLYRYPWWVQQGPTINRVPYVYHIWRRFRVKYPSTLYVEVSAQGQVEYRNVLHRPQGPYEIEVGRLSFDELINASASKKKDTDAALKNMIHRHKAEKEWRRRDNQPCKIPNRVMYRVHSGENGSFACAFSKNGLILAVACVNRQSYPIKLYDVLTGDRICVLEGHQDLVYRIIWSQDNSEFISASADGSVRTWRFFGDGRAAEASIYQHPTFVYSVCYHPSSSERQCSRLVASGAYDGIIRLWRHESRTPVMHAKPFHKPIQKLVGHNSNVNALEFDGEGSRLFSGDAQGIIMIWTSKNYGGLHSESHIFDDFAPDFVCTKTIDTLQGNPIHTLVMHPSNRRLLIHTAKGNIKVMDTRIYRFLTHVQVPRSDDHSHMRSVDEWLARTSNMNMLSGYPKPFGEQVGGLTAPSKMRTPMHLSPIHERKAPMASNLTFIRASFTPCGNYVFCGSNHGSVYVWQVETGALVATYESISADGWEDINAPVVDIAFHPSDHFVCFSVWGRAVPVKIWTWDPNVPEIGKVQQVVNPPIII